MMTGESGLTTTMYRAGTTLAQLVFAGVQT